MKWTGYTRKGALVAVHACFWVVVFALPFFLRPTFQVSHQLIEQNSRGLGALFVINRLLWVGLFYLTANRVVPAFVYRKNWWALALFLLALFALLFTVDWGLFTLFTEGMPFQVRNFFSFNFVSILFILVASTAYRMIRDRLEAERREQERETETLKTELSLLRSQVSPHFLFNILNNMVALARKKSDRLEPSLIQLSALLRYMLYEAGERVPLEKEIEYLQSYIDLQQLRFGQNVTVRTSMDQIDRSYEIEPMLLIPFVENAFKHGTGLIEDAEIKIELRAENNVLTFSVRNKFLAGATEIKDSASGIGLVNVQRRLALLYGQNHSLLLTRQGMWFIVSLQIVLVP
ncbi:histidine kinase [Paraflavisolibacter sp. H34]|uniref:sensor histidine kinase n=1 Tax=Huijunlia imazamoxiresistens TaxID=3127457 RepID=UPI003015F667